MSEEDNKKNEGKGFAGLSSLLSDINVSAPSEPVKNVPPSEARAIADAPSPPPTPRPQPAPASSTQPNSGSSNGKWIIGVAAVIGLLWIVGQANKTPSSSSPTYPPSAQTQAPSPYTDPVPIAQPQAPSRPFEETPPAGQGHSLSISQIRYCVAEDIRVNGARAAVNNYNDSHVDRFNAMVADYNSRCGQFRYRRGALESARQDVEPYRNELQAEGRGRLESVYGSQGQVPRQSDQGSQPSFVTPAPQATRPDPDPTVFAIQQKLNQLGYEAGVADGFAGSGTRAAIIAFQRDRGISQDGVASDELLNELGKNANRSSKPTSSTTASPREPVNQRPGVPDNAYVSGSDWYCKDGFRQVKDRCDAVVAPQNAYISGHDWYCKDGFRQVNDRCDAVIAPQNAYISGHDWYCKEGFRQVGNQCDAVIAPQNAYVSGHDWYCKEGFRQVGNRCDAVVAPPNGYVSGHDWYCKSGFRQAGNQCVPN